MEIEHSLEDLFLGLADVRDLIDVPALLGVDPQRARDPRDRASRHSDTELAVAMDESRTLDVASEVGVSGADVLRDDATLVGFAVDVPAHRDEVHCSVGAGISLFRVTRLDRLSVEERAELYAEGKRPASAQLRRSPPRSPSRPTGFTHRRYDSAARSTALRSWSGGTKLSTLIARRCGMGRSIELVGVGPGLLS